MHSSMCNHIEKAYMSIKQSSSSCINIKLNCTKIHLLHILNLFSNFSAKNPVIILKYVKETEFSLLAKQGLVPAEHKPYTNHA